MSINIQALRAFQAVAGTGNFTRAAEQCYLSQPAFSRLIASLEKELGVKLFHRSTRRVELTEEGKICLVRTKQILSAYDLMLSDLERMRNGQELRVGFNPLSGPPEFLVWALRRMGEEYPGTQVNLVRAYSYDLVSKVKAGELDCALVSAAYIEDAEEALEQKALQRIHTYALMHRSLGLAERSEISMEELSGSTLIFMKNSAPLTRRSALKKLEELGVPVREDPPADDLEELVLRVRLGNVIGITSFSDPNGQYKDLTAVPLRQSWNRSCRVLAWRRDCRNPALPLLQEILDQEAPLGREEIALS